MAYGDFDIWEIYHNILRLAAYPTDPQACAIGWVEAENDMAVRAVYNKWFGWLEDGTADDHYPDPDLPVDADYADRLIAELDDDFEKESLMRVDAEAYPEYRRLSPHARLAFAQDIRGIIKKQPVIVEEALRRLAAGEIFPPGQPFFSGDDVYTITNGVVD